MRVSKQRFLLFLFCMTLTIGACRAPVTSTPTMPSPKNIPEVVSTASNTPEPTPTQDLVDTSFYSPEIASTSTETIYEQQQRATLGKTDTFFWPDGNIGLVPFDGQFRFFAANSTRSAVSVGTLDDPGNIVENHRLTIAGVDSEFSYASGGPVYRDPDSGLLLMFYHAERHLNGNGSIFHASIGLAASQDDGQTFQNLGIILENNAPPDAKAPCCADMGGATYTIKDGQFLVYFRDRLEDLNTIELAVATAAVDEVIEAAKNGMVTPWSKYNNNGQQQPGISGLSSPLEAGNPPTDWFSISYNMFIDRYIMAILTHVRSDTNNYQLYLTTSEDGYQWSPRVLLMEFNGEMAYPTIIAPDGNPLNTSETFYIYYVTTPVGVTRWHNTKFERMTVTLSGQMLEPSHGWEFEDDAEGWKPLYHMDTFEIQNSALIIQATGNDPYMASPPLGINGDTYKKIEIRMKTGQSGTGQFFFTTKEFPYHVEETSVAFDVDESDEYITYTVDMSASENWKGIIGDIRFDPIDQATTIEIDYIRLIP